MQGFRSWNCKTHQPDKERKKKNLIPFLGQSVATVNRLKPKVNKDMLVSCGKKVTGSRLVQESCRHWCWQWHCVEPDAGQGCAGSVPHHPDLGSPYHSSKFPPFPRERRRMVHTLWGRSIIWQTLLHSGVIAENVTTVTWNQALPSHRGFYLFPYEAAPAVGRIKVVCMHFAAKWLYLMASIPKALTHAAGFSLSHPEHMLVGCRISDVVKCQWYRLKNLLCGLLSCRDWYQL